MKLKYLLFAAPLGLAWACATSHAPRQETALKDMYEGKFTVGVAVNTNQAAGLDSLGKASILRHFNSIVAENCMKCEKIHPEEGVYDWVPADSFVNLGIENNMEIIGHCLVWHSQLAPWFLLDEDGNEVDSTTLKKRMRDHIMAVAGRYKGKIKGWDVVNEAILDDGSYRESAFYRILGEEFIPYAFQLAHEADPDAELYLNDFSMAKPGKRDRYVKIVNDLRARGIRIDGIGMQSHMGLDYPDFDEYEESLKAFAATGVKVMATEVDMTVLPTITTTASVEQSFSYDLSMDPFPDGLTDEVAGIWNSRMSQFFDIMERNSDAVARVTIWGVSDGDSWRNDWPMPGRTDYPTLLDRNHHLKQFRIKK